MNDNNRSRREFIKKVAYVAPVVLTLNANAAFASQGSNLSVHCDNGFGTGSDCSPPGLVNNVHANHVNQDD
jgi:hypothetical protein